MASYSFSSIDLYENCPWAYRKVKKEGIKRITSEPQATGRTVHNRVANYLERLIKSRNRTDLEWPNGTR